MKATARKTPFGYKAVIVHANGRTEILARSFALSADKRSMEQVKAGKNFATREEAISYAERTIEVSNRESAIYEYRFKRKPDGTRPSREEAIAALGFGCDKMTEIPS